MHAKFAALLLAATALSALPAAGQTPAQVQPTETGARTAYPIAFFADAQAGNAFELLQRVP